MRFVYQAKNREGAIKSGFVVAESGERAERLLIENGFSILSITEQNESFLEKYNPFKEHVSYKEVVLFSRQLSTLIGARVPILQSLRILENQIENKTLLGVIRDLITSVENGESFSLALSKHPQVFSNIYVSLVRSGEASGAVAKSLIYLADELEKDYEIRSKVKGALTYPGFILFALLGVGFALFKFVLPSLISILEEQGKELPTSTVIVISVTHFMNSYWWTVLVGILGLVVAIHFYLDTVFGRYQWDNLKPKLPVIGDIFEKIYLARFARNLATLVSGGIPIIQSLRIISEVINNVVFRDIILDVVVKVTNGSSIADGLTGHSQFPPIVVQMIRVGEQTAQLDNILTRLAEFYEKEVDRKIAVMSSLLEPIVMVVLGVAVGGLVASIILPIYNVALSGG